MYSRVGGLAVALGVGAAVIGGAGVAVAAPVDDSSTAPGAAPGTSASANTRGSARPAGEPRRVDRKQRRQRSTGNPAPAAATAAKPPASKPAPPTTPDPVRLPEVVRAASSVPVPARDAATVAVTEPPRLRPATPAAVAAPALSAAPAAGAVTAVPSPFTSTGPGSPAESTAGWVVLAAVRRAGRLQTAARTAATVSTGQVVRPAATVVGNRTPTVAPTLNPQSATGAITGNLNAVDADGDPVTFTVETKPAYGTVTVDTAGRFAYTPNKASAHTGVTDKFTVTGSDSSAGFHIHKLGTGHTVTRTVTLTVKPVNAPPTATTSVGSPNPSTGVVTGRVTGADPDGDPMTYTGSATTAKGSVVVAADGSFSYKPTAPARHAAAKLTAPAADKTDAFTVTVTDSYGASKAVAVTVPIAPANTAPTGSATVGAPNPSTGVVTGSLTGTDPDADPLVYGGPLATAKGTLAVAANGAFTYTPTAAARHDASALGATSAAKTDTLTLTITDGYGGSASVPVIAAIAPANSAPTATVGIGATDPATGVVRGTVKATDQDKDSLSYAVPATTAKGSVVVAGDGTFTYTPTAAARHAAAAKTATAAAKSDAFTVTVTDGHGGSLAVPVSVAISPANAAPTGSASVGSPDPATGSVAGSVAGRDADADPLTYSGSATTAKGAVTVAADGKFTYKPTAAAQHNAAALSAVAADKTDTFTVTVSDSYGGATAVPVTVAIAPANRAPVASAGLGVPDRVTGVAAGKVTATDADTDPLAYTSVATAKGSAVLGADGTITYTPTAIARHAAAKLTATAADKTDSFTVTVTDGHGGSAAVPLSVAIAPDNAVPTASTKVGVPDATTGVVAGALIGSDLNGDALSYNGSQTTAKGKVVVSPDGSFTYTPTALARHVASLANVPQSDVVDNFTLAVSDGYGGTVSVPVSVSVSPASVTFNFVYGSGSQYWTAAERSALQAAADRLSSYIVVEAPVTLTYDVVGQSSPNSGLLATAYAKFATGGPGYYPTVVQKKVQTGVDANGSASDSQITVNFAYPWALGDTVPNNQYDFQSVAMHELVHTFGFMTGLGDPAAIDTNWTTYDRYLATAGGTSPIGTDFVWNATYTPNLTGSGGGLYFTGPNAQAAYGGPVPLYTPSRWSSGGSLTHFDPARAPAGTTYLMDPTDGYGPGVRVITPVELGMMKDLGYTVYQV